MRLGEDWLRDNGAPHAGRVMRGHDSDFTGLGIPAGVEMTISPWDEIGGKARQAAGDAAGRGESRWVVWKRRRAEPGERAYGPGQWWAVTEFAQWWQDQLELKELRATVAMYQAEFGRLLDAQLARKEAGK
jgi:hypothetical protein